MLDFFRHILYEHVEGLHYFRLNSVADFWGVAYAQSYSNPKCLEKKKTIYSRLRDNGPHSSFEQTKLNSAERRRSGVTWCSDALADFDYTFYV